MPQPPFIPTAQQRAEVAIRVTRGESYYDIAAALAISKPTLMKHFRKELKESGKQLNAMIAGGVAKKALAGDMAASFFWLKCKAGWREKDRFQQPEQAGNVVYGWADDVEAAAVPAKKTKRDGNAAATGDAIPEDQVQAATGATQISRLPN